MPKSKKQSGEYFYNPKEKKKSSTSKKTEGSKNKATNAKIIAIVLVVVFVLGGISLILIKKGRESRQRTLIEVQEEPTEAGKSPDEYPLANQGDVSPISGLECENWNRRPITVMQPSDTQARPLAGLSEADMVVEMPVLVGGKTRLMGVYVCGDPEEVGSMRSARHDFIHLAKGMDAMMVHWGGSQFAKEKFDEGVIDHLNCNNDAGKSAGQCCYRKEVGTEGFVRGVDTAYAKFDELKKCAAEFGYRMEGKFSGYPHQGEAPIEDRPTNGEVKIDFDGSKSDNFVQFSYDQETNSYLRIWGRVPDKDRNNDERIAPKNVVVLIADQELMVDDNETSYNNVQLGDPWYDVAETGEAFYYFNGKETKGRWEKASDRDDSKLLLLNEDGEDIKFVQGQIWLAIVEPGRSVKWYDPTAVPEPATTTTTGTETTTTETTDTTTAQ